jgi:hypothetical protein
VTRRRPWLPRAPGRSSRPPRRRGRAVGNGLVARRPPAAAKRPSPGRTGHARRLSRRPCSKPNDGRRGRWRRRDVAAAAAGGEVFDPDDRPATAGMGSGRRRQSRPPSGRCWMRAAPDPKPPPPASRARPSPVARRSACARETGRCRHPSQYRLARGGPRRLARPLSVAAERADAEPADRRTGHPAPRGCGPSRSTALCPTFCGESLPTARLQPTPVLRRGPEPGSETPPGGNRHPADVQPTQLKSRQPALTRLVGARFAIRRIR